METTSKDDGVTDFPEQAQVVRTVAAPSGSMTHWRFRSTGDRADFALVREVLAGQLVLELQRLPNGDVEFQTRVSPSRFVALQFTIEALASEGRLSRPVVRIDDGGWTDLALPDEDVSGDPAPGDDPDYRRSMIDAGRGRLLR